MKTSISCAASALALLALAGGAQAQVLGGATTMANTTVRGALDSVSARSALGAVNSAKTTALSTAGPAVTSAKAVVGDRVADTAGLARDRVDAARTSGLAAGRTASRDVRGVQGQLAQPHQVRANTIGYGGASADLIAGDANAAFRDYAGLGARTPGVETRDATDRARSKARMVVSRARDGAGDIIVIAHDRAGDARERAADRARGATHAALNRVHGTKGEAVSTARSGVHKVKATAGDLRSRPLPSASAKANGSARITIASNSARGKASAVANTRARRAAASVSATGL